jgi:hypothetical protein
MSTEERRGIDEERARQERIQRLLDEMRAALERKRAIVNQMRAEKGWPPLEPRRRF